MISAIFAVVLMQVAPIPSAAHFRAARAAFDRQMFDYQSARFADVRGNDAVLCGRVNGKNRLGAYAGWQPFAFVRLDSEPALYIDDDIMVDAFCGDLSKFRSDDHSSRLAPGAR